MNNSSRREVSPSTEPPALNGAKSGQRKGWLKKIFSQPVTAPFAAG